MSTPWPAIQLTINGETRCVNVPPMKRLLDVIREDLHLTGTKEGCGEGECGSCSVRLNGELVNSCLVPALQAQGANIQTVEGLGREDELHPLQVAFLKHGGAQCGMCTPGVLMAAAQLLENTPNPTLPEIREALAGNLCRCTGYQPIIAAGSDMFRLGTAAKAAWQAGQASMAQRLAALRDGRTLEIAKDGRSFVAPADLDSFAELYATHPDATIVAGATDAGLWVTKEMRILERVLHPGRIAALSGIEDRSDELTIGAMTSLTEAADPLGAIHPQLRELLRRFGGEQVRNAGTVGGNIANGSPIGDLPPALIALGATLRLRRGSERRELPLEAFFIAYKRQDRRPGEFVEAVLVPKLAAGSLFHASKISKRFDEDISALCGAFLLSLDAGGRVAAARLAYGGMAGTPKRAAHAEKALIGEIWNEAAAERAGAALEQDFQPHDDWRASARYRMLCAKNLLRRFALESAEPELETRVAGELADIGLAAARGAAAVGRRI